MKRHNLALSLASLPLILSACAGNDTAVYHEEYSMYYGIWDHAGLNLYCWTIDEEWFAGLSTARSGVYDSVEDVEALQEIGCPISVMKDILDSYGEEIVAYQVTVFVASVPPLQEELIPGSESREQYAEDILYLCEYFGIDPYYQSL